MNDYERALYKSEIARLRQEVKRQRVLLELWAEAARLDYEKREVPSGPNEQAEGKTRRA